MQRRLFLNSDGNCPDKRADVFLRTQTGDGQNRTCSTWAGIRKPAQIDSVANTSHLEWCDPLPDREVGRITRYADNGIRTGGSQSEQENLSRRQSFATSVTGV